MNIIRYYNQNRIFIWTIIIAIIILIIAIQALNNIVKNQKDNKAIENIIREEDYKNNLSIDVLLSDEDVKEEEELIIDQFIRYCNAGKIERAYNLLTDDCKKELFPTIDYFKKNYYNTIFNSTKLYSKEKLYSDTYKIKYYEDILSSGNINTSNIEDYYTIKYEGDIVKLNISNYIGSKKLKTIYENKKIKIKVISKKIFKEYEEYEIEVSNLSDKTILLDSKEKTKTVYLKGKKDVKYYSLLYEVLNDNLIIKPKGIRKLNIKFSKEYNSNNKINGMVFSDIIMDYEEYKNEKVKRNYKDRNSISIDF